MDARAKLPPAHLLLVRLRRNDRERRKLDPVLARQLDGSRYILKSCPASFGQSQTEGVFDHKAPCVAPVRV